jgi:WD40 repeat protein
MHSTIAGYRSVEAHSSPIAYVSLTSGETVIVSSDGQSTRLWDAETLEPIAEQAFHGCLTSRLAVAGDAPVAIAPAPPDEVQILDLLDGTVLRRAPVSKAAAAALTADGRIGACAGEQVFVLSTADLERLTVIPREASSCAISPDGQRLLIAGEDFTELWDRAHSTPLLAARGCGRMARGCCLSANGRWGLSWGSRVRVWDTIEDAVWPLKATFDARSMAIDDEGRLAVLIRRWESGKRAVLWDVRQDRQLLMFDALDAEAVHWSSTPRRALVGDRKGRLHVYDIE